MAVSGSHRRQRGLFVFGMMLVGLGGGLLVRLAMLFVLGRNGPGFNAEMAWRAAGGAILIVFGFSSMAWSSAASDNWAVDFEKPHSTHFAEAEMHAPLPDLRGEPFGPPRPQIVVRCPNCRTLNEQSETVCAGCRQVL